MRKKAILNFFFKWWKQILGSVVMIGLFIVSHILIESYCKNSSLATLLSGTVTSGFVLGMLKIWITKPKGKTWLEASKEALDFLQAILVVTVFLLLIYHAYLNNLIGGITPQVVLFTGRVVENPTGEPIADCTATIQFFGKEVQKKKCSSKEDGTFNCTFHIYKLALDSQAIVQLSHPGYDYDKPFILQSVDSHTFDIGNGRYLVKKQE
jgi:hypothetical protein